MDERTRLAPYLAVIDRQLCNRAFELSFNQYFFRVDLQQYLQVVLAHSPKSLAPVKRPHQECIQTIGYSIFKEHEGRIDLPPHY